MGMTHVRVTSASRPMYKQSLQCLPTLSQKGYW